MQTTPVTEHGKYSPDEWFLCHLVDGSWRAVVASLLLELDMRWPESVAQDSTPVEKVFLHELPVKLMMRSLAGERRCGGVVK